MSIKPILLTLGLMLMAGCAGAGRQGLEPITPGVRYVAMGSSFAAGPGIDPQEHPRTRCTRSMRNYAHQLAERRALALVDVSCGGATTAHLLGSWNELPPQLDAVTPETGLVTVTIGGNDVGYVGGLAGATCAASGIVSAACPRLSAVAEDRWVKLRADMTAIAQGVRRRAPNARLIFVDYVTLIPDGASCAATRMSDADATALRALAARLAALTAEVARANGAQIMRASALSRGHSACDADPWAAGFPYPGGPRVLAPYHPTLPGMTAIADALNRMIWH